MLLPFETQIYERRKGDFLVSTSRERLDMTVVIGFLTQESYWAKGLDPELIERAVRCSLPFGIYRSDGRQIGFARTITDGALFAYYRDVFVLDDYRGQGLGTWVTRCAVEHPDLASVRSWVLATKDAHEVYRRAGFGRPEDPGWYMQLKKD